MAAREARVTALGRRLRVRRRRCVARLCGVVRLRPRRCRIRESQRHVFRVDRGIRVVKRARWPSRRPLVAGADTGGGGYGENRAQPPSHRRSVSAARSVMTNEPLVGAGYPYRPACSAVTSSQSSSREASHAPGSSSSMALIGYSCTRARTSARYSKGLIPPARGLLGSYFDVLGTLTFVLCAR